MSGVGAEGIDHVSIAVTDLDGAVAFFTGVLGLRVAHSEVNEREGVSEVMLVGAGGGAQVQLIAPIARADAGGAGEVGETGGTGETGGNAPGPDAVNAGGLSGVAKFLHERGSAIHHIALQVADIGAAAAAARSAGVRVLSDTALSGTSGSQVVFLHPKDCHGVLIELAQPAS
jgi:methylmalonyl-CoA/ethylmalonyl-CoA epimerase